MPPNFLNRAELIEKVEKMIELGWIYKGSFWTFNKATKTHYYEIRLSRSKEKEVLHSPSQFPYVVNSEGKIIKKPNGRREEGFSNRNH